MITYRPGSQQRQSNALSRHLYLTPKEGDTVYDQQHLVLLKPERLLLQTLQTTTSDPLALKFKQSCADSRPQNGQIKVPNSQIPDSEIQNPESPDF
jgi:hypothetical protein